MPEEATPNKNYKLPLMFSAFFSSVGLYIIFVVRPDFSAFSKQSPGVMLGL